MNKPVITLQRYEVDQLLISRELTERDFDEETFDLDANVGIAPDKDDGSEAKGIFVMEIASSF